MDSQLAAELAMMAPKAEVLQPETEIWAMVSGRLWALAWAWEEALKGLLAAAAHTWGTSVYDSCRGRSAR